MKIYEELNDWKWRFGRSPEFTHNIEHKYIFELITIDSLGL